MKSRVQKPEIEDVARRVPTQERSKRRVQKMIDSAALVFAEQGYEAATMEGIAERAETSIGSIYQFFPNKLSLFNALARHYHDKLRVFFDALLAGPLIERPWPEILDSGIDALTLFHAQEPGFRAVWVGLHLTEQVITEGEAINREFAQRIETVLAAKLVGLSAKPRSVVATMLVEILTAMLIVSARRPDEAKVLMAETKVLLRRYLAPYEARDSRSARRVGSRALGGAGEGDSRKAGERARPAVRSGR
jgi:AcrR family transcriptional regulator